MAPLPRPTPPQAGLRVKHARSGRIAMVSGRPEPKGNTQLIPVTLEGTTRTELWPAGLTLVLPVQQQSKALGGTLELPPGYPLRLPDAIKNSTDANAKTRKSKGARPNP